MMAKIVMKNPCISCNPGMECVNQFEHPVREAIIESMQVLMMMIPGAYTNFWYGNQCQPGDQNPYAVRKHENSNIKQEQTNDKNSWYDVLLLAKLF